MSEETLLSAARRFVRFFDIDMEKGALITTETQVARDILAMQIDKERKRQEQERNTTNAPE